MGDECSYSFWDLFEAANKRRPRFEEKEEFLKISQTKRNQLIKKWAKNANWGIDDRMGTDGKVYTAFCPLWKRQNTNKHEGAIGNSTK